VLSHARSPAVYAAGVVIAAALLRLVPRVGSRVMSVGAGLAAGGAVATVVSGLAWRDGVPNPLHGGGVAFDVADVAIALGVLLLVGGALAHGWINRQQLFAPL
jgi:hypothetical protein